MIPVDLYRRFPPRMFSATPDNGSLDDILVLWRRGKDTYDIAAILQVPEPLIERRLHMSKDQLLRDQEWNWPPKGQS